MRSIEIKSNQYGYPGKTYYYLYDHDKECSLSKNTLKCYRGKQLNEYKFDTKEQAKEFLSQKGIIETFHIIHKEEKAAKDHKQRIENRGGVVIYRKLYSESRGKHYYDLVYTFKEEIL